MIKKQNYIVLLMLLIFVTSCFDSNKIYFDIQEQSIKSCNHKGIRDLYIENTETSDLYHLVFNDTVTNNTPKVIYIDSISSVYSIYQGWQKKILKNKLFRLNPLSQYEIERVQGDASAHKLNVWTDENGKVVRSSKEKCTY